MQTMLRAITTRAGGFAGTHSAAPRLAASLLALAGAWLVVGLPLAALGVGVPLEPFVMWLSWMALLAAAAVAVLAVLRVRRLERALQRERRRFRALAEAVPAGVCQFDADGALVFSNAVCETLFGGSPKTCSICPCSGGPVFRGMPPDERARLRGRWEIARHDRKPFAEDFRLVAEGAERWVSLKAVPFAEGGHLGYVCCVAERAGRPRSGARTLAPG